MPAKVRHSPHSTKNTSYSMNPSTLLSKLQSKAAPDQALIHEEVKDNGSCIIIQFSAGLFALAVKPALSCLSKDFNRVVNGHQIFLQIHPDYVYDKQGLLVNIKMQFHVKPVSAPLQSRKVVLHLYTTQTKIMTQGGSPISDSHNAPTAAQWFVTNFIYPTI